MSALRCVTSAARCAVQPLRTLPLSTSGLRIPSTQLAHLGARPNLSVNPLLLISQKVTPLRPMSYHMHPRLPELGRGYEYIHVVTNESRQAKAQNIWKTIPLQGNTLTGCAVLINLNLASLRPEITHLNLFDIREKVGLCWKDIQQIMKERDPTRILAVKRFIKYLKDDPWALACLMEEIKQGVSFLSTEERFAQARKFFRGGHHISFTKLDLCDPKAFSELLKQQQEQQLTPAAFYLSNIGNCLDVSFESQKPPTLQEQHLKYKKFRESLNLIPDHAAVIDAQREWLPNKSYSRDSILRVHPKAKDSRAFIMPPPAPELFAEALMSNDYDKVRDSLLGGANRIQFGSQNYTSLMFSTEFFKTNSLRAVLNFAQETGSLHMLINERDMLGRSALDIAIRNSNSEAIQLLEAHGAKRSDPDVVPLSGSTKRSPFFAA